MSLSPGQCPRHQGGTLTNESALFQGLMVLGDETDTPTFNASPVQKLNGTLRV